MRKPITVTGPNGSFSGFVLIDTELEMVAAHYNKICLYNRQVKEPMKFLKIVEDAEYYLREHLNILANQKINVPDLEKQLVERGYSR